ncbi:MAG: isopentenyl-diphosphate delta-isomerase, partial [Blautia sp.]
EQLADSEQTGALAQLLRSTLEQLADGRRTFPQICQQLQTLLDRKGLDGLFGSSLVPGNLAVPRIQEIRCCLNRYRGWKTK